MKIKTFKGKLADGGMDKIRLGTNTGLTGYKVRKLEIIPANPGGSAVEQVVKVYLQEPASVTGTVNFDNPLLLAVAYIAVHSDNVGIVTQIISFDHVKFNQDIYITHSDEKDSQDCNYYLELEQVKLNVEEATVATLKDMRGRE